MSVWMSIYISAIVVGVERSDVFSEKCFELMLDGSTNELTSNSGQKSEGSRLLTKSYKLTLVLKLLYFVNFFWDKFCLQTIVTVIIVYVSKIFLNISLNGMFVDLLFEYMIFFFVYLYDLPFFHSYCSPTTCHMH